MGSTEYSRAILLEGITVDGAWRNGLSVISEMDFGGKQSVFANTNGTNPQCGIDLEPNLPSDRLQGIKFARCEIADSQWAHMRSQILRSLLEWRLTACALSACQAQSEMQPLIGPWTTLLGKEYSYRTLTKSVAR